MPESTKKTRCSALSGFRDSLDDFRCGLVIRRHSKTFYRAFSRIPDAEKRKAVYAVYAFCRYADDLADEGGDTGALTRLKEDLASLRDGRCAQPRRR